MSARSFGTTEEKILDLRKAWSMTNLLTGAAVFVTLTPNDVGSAVVHYFSGKSEKESIIELGLEDVPLDNSENDPMASYLYFEKIKQLFFSKVIGWNSEENRPTASGGLFGIPRGYFGRVESQEKGTLHFHPIILLEGFPNTSDEFETPCLSNDNNFHERIIKYVDSICKCTTDVDASLEEFPKYGQKEIKLKVDLEKEAFQLQKRKGNPTATLFCKKCNNSYGSDQIIRNIVRINYSNNTYIPQEIKEFIHESENWREIFENDKVADKLTRQICSIPKTL